MSVDFYASERHLVDHLLPIYFALEPHERGTFFARRRVAPLLAAHGIEAVVKRPRGEDAIVTASYSDMRDAVTHSGRVVLAEHGVGQRYDDNPSNPGGTGRERVALYICPSKWVAQLNLDAYPNAEAAVVGSPHLDALQSIERTPEVPVIAFHWNCNLAPEAGWAFPHFRAALADVAERFPGAIGHAHPRVFRKLEPSFLDAGLIPVERLSEAIARASVWVQDNSSCLYEAAALGIPVVAMNSPAYRRDVHLPPRFWSHVPGIQVSEPEKLVTAIERAIEDKAPARDLRRRAVEFVYSRVDGKASERAAQAIRLLVDGTP